MGSRIRRGPIAHHDRTPLDAVWVETPGGKKCLRPNGNRVETTIYLHMLVNGFKATMPFKSTSLPIARAFQREADKIRMVLDGEPLRVCVAMWLLSSTFVERNGNKWWAPIIVKQLGKLGEEGGPSLELVKKARDLRFEFRAEEENSEDGGARRANSDPGSDAGHRLDLVQHGRRASLVGGSAGAGSDRRAEARVGEDD